MDVFNFIGARGYEIIHCVNDDDYVVFRGLDGTLRTADWKPILVKRVRGSRREGFRASDCPYYGNDVLILRRSAVDALRDILDAHGELLPLATEDGVELFAFNPQAIDALDVARSTVFGVADDGRLGYVEKHMFFPSVVDGVDMFKISNRRGSTTYLSERFVERFNAANLKGLEFRKVWSSDLPPEAQPKV
jgi:hypothetical protein